MCGIGGFLQLGQRPLPSQAINACWRNLAHRGPDDHGVYQGVLAQPVSAGAAAVMNAAGTSTFRAGAHTDPVWHIAIMHTRLAILDVTGGRQPMLLNLARGGSDPGQALQSSWAGNDLRAEAITHDADRWMGIAFNGCIYNHHELRQSLISSSSGGSGSASRAFISHHSDTEVLLHAAQRWNVPHVFDRTEGMFAVALWDGRQRTLHLARDRFGEKPLYYWTDHPTCPTRIAFASTMPALIDLVRSGGAKVDLDWGHPAEDGRLPWWLEYLRFGWCENALPYQGARIVEPGTCVSFELFDSQSSARMRTTRYWSIENSSGPRPDPSFPTRNRTGEATTMDQAVDEIARLLAHSVRARLQADVPLGCFLSGGIDSSLIAFHAAQVAPNLRTFCVRMPEPGFDESETAAEVARHIGTDHRTLDVEAQPAEDLTHLIAQLGLPFADSSLLPTYWVSKAARSEVAVALSGDGGDEIFAGYQRYRGAQYLHRFGSVLQRLPDFSWMRQASGRSRAARISRLGRAARNAGYLDLVSLFDTPAIEQLLGRTIPESEKDSQPIEGLAAAMRWDQEHYLPCDLLRKTDTASMSVALEVRCPMLDSELTRSAFTLPTSLLIKGGKTKAILRRLAATHLPAHIAQRPKAGFAVPIGEWFRNDYGGMGKLLMENIEVADTFRALPLESSRLLKVAHEHLNGIADHSQRLFGILTLLMFLRHERG